MSQTIENYVPQAILPLMRKQAWKVWFVGLAVVLVWNLLIALAPIAKLNGVESISATLYSFFSYICHQMDSRSLHLHNEPLAVCARCFGVYFGLLIGFVIYPAIHKIEETEPFSRLWLFFALIPIGVDWSLTAFGLWENTHLSRFITGLILGAACAVFIVPGLVEIFWNLTYQKQIKKLSR